MTGLYQCDKPWCDWENPNFRYGLAEAGATWAEHMAEHRPKRVHNHRPWRSMCNERDVDGQLRGACLNDDGSDREELRFPPVSRTADGGAA